MELGHIHLQLIMSVTLILTAAIVAFICDVLKRNNEQLREMNMELQLRQQQEQMRWAVPVPQVTEWAPQAEKIAQPIAHVAIKKDRSPVSREKKRAVNPEALAVMERGAALARPAPSAPVRESQPTAAKKDWGSLLSRNAQKANSLPPGFHPGFEDGLILSNLVQSREPVSGLVVSIGVDASSKTKGKLAGDVRKLVESLIGPNDFAAQSGEDEFLLIYPQEHGASAQRRLSEIARQLWDFQLRSLGSLEILFSWGGVEVRSESIEEAFASASERMQETKRGRKLLTPVNELRQAV